MAKLTLDFKGKILRAIPLDIEETRIGRDPSSTICIDSLAVAPEHALILRTPEGYVIRQLDQAFPMIINGKRVAEHTLGDGDSISIGKHTLFFTDEPPPIAPSEGEALPETSFGEPIQTRAIQGGLQVLTGKQMGVVFPVRNGETTLGKAGAGMVVVTRTDDAHTIAIAEDGTVLTVNGIAVERDPVPLKDGDIVRFNNLLLQYFQDNQR